MGNKLAIIVFIVLLFVGFYFIVNKKSVVTQLALNINNSQAVNIANEAVTNNLSIESKIVEPISNALARITKKPFGLKVSPQDSPVSPEKFSGYHTGTDFETTAAEKDIDVPIFAICSGPLVLEKKATGYGGVVVQSCQLNQQDVRVVYGHLRLASIETKINQALKAGEQIGVLGTGYSIETDGERKHLHLSIHQGKDINILGYVQKQTDLANWFDFTTLIK